MRKFTNEKIKVSEKKVGEVVNNENLSKSGKMRELFNMGFSVKEISNLLGVRYNFVYNVISNYVNVNEIKVVNEKTVTKKELIIKLYNEGKTRKEISITLKTNYNYVFNVIKEYTSKEVNNEEEAE